MDEVGDHQGVARNPQPWRKRRDDAAAVEKTDRSQVEEVEHEARVGEGRPERIARRHVDQEAHGRAEGPEDRAADAHHRLDPGISRGVLQRDERPHERDEHRGADPEALAARRDQMTQLVDQDQHHEAEGELPAPQEGVGPDAEDHGAAGLEEGRQELQEGQQRHELRAELEDRRRQKGQRPPEPSPTGGLLPGGRDLRAGGQHRRHPGDGQDRGLRIGLDGGAVLHAPEPDSTGAETAIELPRELLSENLLPGSAWPLSEAVGSAASRARPAWNPRWATADASGG